METLEKPKTKLARAIERNEKKFADMADLWLTRENAAFKKKFGYDMTPQISKPGFNLREAGRQLRDRFKLSEAVTETQLYALTVGLITQKISDAYKLQSTIYKSLAKVLQSTTAESSYLGLQGGDIPVLVGENEDIPESRIGGVLTRIANYEYGRIFAISERLLEDDQTGEIADVAEQIGERMSYTEEQAWIISLFQSYQASNVRSEGVNGGIIPPMNIAGQAPANYGGPVCTPGSPSQVGIENLLEAADFITDLEGNFALVQINAGLFSSADKIAVKKIMQSVYNPSTPPAGNGVVGGIFSENVLKGEFDLFFTPFVQRARVGLAGAGTRAWGLGEAGKIGGFQERTSLEVKIEAPDAGKSFDQRARRTRVHRRFGVGTVLPEFFLAGN